MKELSVFIDESGDFGEYDYKLFQVADLICSMELIRLKMENHQYSHSEELFFGKQYELKRNYLRIIQKKRMEIASQGYWSISS